VADDARVLIVDDEQGITDLVSMALRYEGLSVEVAHTGGDALRAVERFRPHLMILDVMLPDFDGFEVLRRLSGGPAAGPRPLPHRTRGARRQAPRLHSWVGTIT